jgi:hypothetical protein
MPGIVAVLPGEDRPQLRRTRPPRGQDQLGVGRAVVLAQRPGQIPGVQVPFGASRTRHRAHGDVGPPVSVVRQVPGRRQAPAVGSCRLGERHDVLRSRHIRQRGKLGGVLPSQLAGERVRGRVGRHQPRQPAGRGIVEVLVVVVGDAPQVTREVHGPPLTARRRREPGRVGELSGQLADHRNPVAVGGQDARAGDVAHRRLRRLVLLRFTVPLPAGHIRQPVREASGAASVPELRPADKPYARRKIR